MATIRPFAALRPRPDLAAKICELPYDVMPSAEAPAMAHWNRPSSSNLTKTKSQVRLATQKCQTGGVPKGAENFAALIAQGALQQDDRPCFYLYRQVMGPHSQTGLVAAASCQEYLDGIIKKHELTRPDKEDDRVRHIEALDSQTGPVFLTYRADAAMDAFVAARCTAAPAVDLTAPDGVRHTAWVVGDAEGIATLAAAFEKIPFLYIADGHHRSAAAGRVYQSRQGAGQSARFLTVVFPHDQMQILPYNRVLKDRHGLTAEALLTKLGTVFDIRAGGPAEPTHKHELALYIGGAWRTLTFRPAFTATDDPIDRLDVTLLQKHVLAPVFGIDDPRTSKRINFVGGIRGTAELEKLVDSGGYACAFSMFPTSIEDLMSIADAGGIMPPKSTWFEPKLRDAMFCHQL